MERSGLAGALGGARELWHMAAVADGQAPGRVLNARSCPDNCVFIIRQYSHVSIPPAARPSSPGRPWEFLVEELFVANCI